jgi:hypothetical protein
MRTADNQVALTGVLLLSDIIRAYEQLNRWRHCQSETVNSLSRQT